jgi:hypothetical protein
MSLFDRRAMFRAFDADVEHQQLAGLASWAAFSARWRARQGLSLLHPLDVHYLTPQDFCNSLGHPLSPEVQRRMFREYVQAAVRSLADMAGCRRAGLVSGDLALVRADGFVRRMGGQPHDFRYGRQDSGPYELRGDRPYGVPVASETVQGYWLDGSLVEDEDDNGDESWIDEWGAFVMASQ